MKKFLTYIFLTFATLISGPAYATLTEGKEYVLLPQPQPTTAGKIEVIEFFWYGCSHCYTIEASIEDWASKLPTDVLFKREHIVWPGRPDLAPHAKLYYTLNTMGLINKYQLKVFRAIQEDRIELRREETLFDWVAKAGIDLKEFKNIYHSFGMQSQLARSQNMTVDYAIQGVPTFVVNGKYQTSPALINKTNGSITNVLNALIAKERQHK